LKARRNFVGTLCASGYNSIKALNSARTGIIQFLVITGKVRQKAVPLQAWRGPEGSRKIRFPNFMTTAQDGGKVVSLTHRPPLPQEMLLALISVRG